MKNIFLVIVCFLIFCSDSVAQQETESLPKVGFGSLIGHLSIGNGIAGGAGTGLLDTLFTETKTKSPVLSLGADYTGGKTFSVGLLAAYQQINVLVDDTLGSFIEEGNINRVYFGFRGLWHYGKKDKVDLYSGFKLGIVRFNTGEISGPNASRSVLEENNNRTRYSFGIIPIGARFIITQEIGIHVQTSIGAPTFLSAGINYRIR